MHTIRTSAHGAILRHGVRLAVMAVLVLLSACGEQKDMRPELKITTVPEGAQVFIDGEKVPKPTPIQGKISPREHLVEVRLEGYQTEWLKIPAQQSGQILREVTLQPVTAAVHITTKPPGATVKIDGRDHGVTPLLIQEVGLGEHEMTLEAAGYAPRVLTVDVPDGRPLKWEYDLTSVMGTLRVASRPGGAEVFIDDKSRGRTPSSAQGGFLTIDDLLEGEHNIRLVMPNHQEVSNQFFMERGVTKELPMYALEPLPGGVTISSEPAGASLYYQGEDIARTPHTVRNLKPGVYEYEVRMEGYRSKTVSVTISAGLIKTETVTLGKTTGGLVLSTEPPGCVVFLDRVRLGMTTRGDNDTVSRVFEHEGIQPGPHRLQIEHPKYEDYTRQIIINEGETLNLKTVQLVERFIPSHRLTIVSPVNGNISVYEGIYLRALEDGSIEFRTSRTTTTTFKKAEIKKLETIR